MVPRAVSTYAKRGLLVMALLNQPVGPAWITSAGEDQLRSRHHQSELSLLPIGDSKLMRAGRENGAGACETERNSAGKQVQSPTTKQDVRKPTANWC
ncbi:hypothetical protein F5B21DRAFT_236163 [Xylaria acuta]|nr:hypothetical protein F5B21DRAFT_236163 [Xylaria acuta]